MADELPPGLLIEETAIQDNYLDRIRALEATVQELKQVISNLNSSTATTIADLDARVYDLENP